jgi:P-type conjugative transfer protein TrbJ
VRSDAAQSICEIQTHVRLLEHVQETRHGPRLSSPTAKVDNANLQIQQLNGELTTLAQIQASSNGAQGQLQATQTQTALVAQLVGQVQKQRQLNLATIMQEAAELKQFKAMGYQSSSVRDRL